MFLSPFFGSIALLLTVRRLTCAGHWTRPVVLGVKALKYPSIQCGRLLPMLQMETGRPKLRR